MSKVTTQIIHEHFNETLDVAKRNNYNLEIIDFALSNILDTNWQEILEEYKLKLEDFTGIISVHGVFLDLYINSTDSKTREVAKQRIYHCLDIARELNAYYIVFHGNYIPLVKNEYYLRNWVDYHSRFWSDVIKEYNLVILLENMWEPTPEIFKLLLGEVRSPQLKICLDTGHINVHSEVTLRDWITTLKDDIPYMHINDNLGNADSELPPGEGNIDWQAFSRTLEDENINPQIVFEVDSLENVLKSIDYFQKGRIYPFNKT